MYPVLRAEEQLSQIKAVGTANMVKADRDKIVSQLEKQASRKEKPKESMTAKLIQLSAMGMAIVDTRKKKT